jgi:arylsulfatase A-like enzyme
MIAAPDAKPGTVCRSLVELVDLYPTVADYSALAAPHQLAGQSLRPLLKNPSAKGRDAAFTLVTRGNKYGQAVRTERWRYIQWSDGNAELYDELADPEETHDLHADPKHAAAIQDLKTLLSRVGLYQPAKPRQT